MPAEEIIRGSVRFTQEDIHRGLLEMNAALRSRYVILGLVLLSTVPTMLTQIDVNLLLSSLFVICMSFGLLFVGPWIRARTTFKAQHLGETDVEYRLDAEGMTIRSPGGTSSTAYRTVYRFRETPAVFLAYAAPGIANIIPKRAFQSADLDRVRALLSLNVKRSRPFPLSLVLIGLIVGLFLFVVAWQFLHAVPAPP